MKKNELPLILTNKTSKVNLDFSKINTFEGRFSKLKKAYFSSNIKTMKKINSQNSYFPYSYNNNSITTNFNQIMNEKKEDQENNPEDAVYRADYISKFKKIKLNLCKNKFIRSEQNIEKEKKNNYNNYNKKNSFINIKENSEEDNKYTFEKYLWSNEINLKNDLNYDIGEDIESDSDNYIELEP